MKKTTKTYAGAGGVVLLASTGAGRHPGECQRGHVGEPDDRRAPARPAELAEQRRHLRQRRRPVDGRRAHVDIDAYRLALNMPHAQHIHFGQEARNECPTAVRRRRPTSGSPPPTASRPTARSSSR